MQNWKRKCVCVHSWRFCFIRNYRELPVLQKSEKLVFFFERVDERALFFNFYVFLACHRKKNHKIIWNCSVFLNGSFVIRNFILYLHVFDFMFAVSLLIFKTTEKNNLCCQYLCALCRWFLLVHPSHLSSFTESLPHSIPQFSDSHKHPSSLSLAGTGSEEEEQVTSAKCIKSQAITCSNHLRNARHKYYFFACLLQKQSCMYVGACPFILPF